MNDLKSAIERIENLEEEKRGVQADIKEIMDELKGKGFDLKAVRAVLKLRKMSTYDREELSSLTEEYLSAVESEV